MTHQAVLEIVSTDTERPLDRSGPLALRGISVEHMSITDTTPYEFELTGDKHYLALHDLMLSNGEMAINGGEPIDGGDLRGKLTYLPPGCPIKGWAAPVARANSFTALYFDPQLMSAELAAKFEAAEPTPHVYFNDAFLKGTLEKLGRIVGEGHS